jgi:hypothetical protein
VQGIEECFRSFAHRSCAFTALAPAVETLGRCSVAGWLFTTPVVYVYLDRLQDFLRRWWRGRR